jgi:hypothetical protein
VGVRAHDDDFYHGGFTAGGFERFGQGYDVGFDEFDVEGGGFGEAPFFKGEEDASSEFIGF